MVKVLSIERVTHHDLMSVKRTEVEYYDRLTKRYSMLVERCLLTHSSSPIAGAVSVTRIGARYKVASRPMIPTRNPTMDENVA